MQLTFAGAAGEVTGSRHLFTVGATRFAVDVGMFQGRREAAARNAALQDYAAKISALIRNRANIPDTVSGKPALTVRLRLLVNGVVFDAQIIKPSGNRVYDEAVERAINGIRQWPLPESADLFGGRRELNLNIDHER